MKESTKKIKVNVFLWEGNVQTVLSNSSEELEVEFIDAYTKRDYCDIETVSDEDAADEYEKNCRENGFHDADFEIGAYKDPEEDDDEDEEE